VNVKKSHLAACPACARHVRVSEPSCPFCHEALPSSFRELVAPPPPATRLSRAALYALGVGTLSAATAACGGAVRASGATDSGQGDGTSVGSGEDSGQDDGSSGVGVPIYGGFAAPDANVAVPYGLPAMEPDAAATDAGTEPDVIHRAPPPPYGGPPPFGG